MGNQQSQTQFKRHPNGEAWTMDQIISALVHVRDTAFLPRELHGELVEAINQLVEINEQ